MAFEQKDNSGVLFKNDRKEKDSHPDYVGNMKAGGINYKLSAWIKTSKKGNKFMSIAISDSDPVEDDGRF